jgi:PPOX class probable F420-dependent enzyme
MSQTLPSEFKDLFEKKSFGHLATVMPDGQPQTTPVWVDTDGECVLVNTAAERQKLENLEREPRVAISIQDPDDPYRYLEVRGRVIQTTDEGADQHIDRLAQRYLGKDRYPWRAEGERRVVVRIQPKHTTSMD